MNRTSVSVQPGFILSIAAGLLLVPIPWVCSWVIAAAVHELFHILAVYLSGEKVLAVKFDFGGAVIRSTVNPGLRSFVCFLAGPIGGLLLLFLIHKFPRIALCGLIQSAYNFLPIQPLDGGNALKSLLFRYLPSKKAHRILRMTESVFLVSFVLLGVYLLVKWNIGLLILAVIFLFCKNKKFLANNSHSQYNMLNID